MTREEFIGIADRLEQARIRKDGWWSNAYFEDVSALMAEVARLKEELRCGASSSSS